MVFEYFQWRCHLCDKDVDKMVRHPDPLSATLDHIVPLRIGGEHVYENCALAHLECNIKKDREIDAPISLHNARLILGLN